MNKWVKIGLLVVAVIFMARMDICGEPPVVNPVQNLAATVNADGSGVTLTWDAPADQTPDGYYVYIDGGSAIDVQETSYAVSTPAAEIAVTAYIGGDESNESTLDFAAVETPSIEVWSINDASPDHPSGFGFALAGTATAYSVAQQPTEIDYWLYQGDNGTLISPSDHQPPYNSELNVISDETGTYEALDIVKGSGNYISQKILVQNSVYGLWFIGDDSDEYFAKMLVSSLTNTSGVIKADLKVACQTYAGLRWVVTD